MTTKKTIQWTMTVGFLAAVVIVQILRSQPVPTGLVARTNIAGQVIAGKLTSLGIWDATPYVKRDFVRASVNAAAIQGTDDSPNITRALADMVRAGYTTLWLPPGLYRINTPIALPVVAGANQPALNFKIVGAGIYPGANAYSSDNFANKVTALYATNGNAIVDWDGVFNISFDSILFAGFTNLSSNNPAPPPYLCRFQTSGIGMPGLTSLGPTMASYVTFKNCALADAIEGIHYANGTQNNTDHCFMEKCQFFGLKYAFHQTSPQTLDCVMWLCDGNQVGEMFFLEQGGHMTYKGGTLVLCGYGVPSAPTFDPTYTFPTPGRYWLFDCGPGGVNAATVNISAVRLDQNSGQLVRSTGGHVINVENIDITSVAWTGDITNPWLFNVTGSNTVFWRGGFLSNGATVHPGTLSSGDIVILDDVATNSTFAASLGTGAGTMVLEHVYVGTALQTSPK